jgi:fructose-1,6-bisphosphatase I
MRCTETTLAAHLDDLRCAEPERRTLLAIASAAGAIAALLARGKRAEPTGAANVHGESVRDYDIVTNELFVDALAASGACYGVVSEELVEPLPLATTASSPLVFLDPLDGSANLDAHGLCGSIFGLARASGDVASAALSSGRQLSHAGYVLYSSATVLVLSSRERCDLLLWDAEQDAFVVVHERLACPEAGSVYSLNDARVPQWSKRARDWLNELKSQTKPNGGTRYSQRYAGALVADAHRVLLEGGVFAYPEDSSSPRGKLRLQYEVNPMAFVFGSAGGAASVGTSSPLDVAPSSCHQRSPLVLGSRTEVAAYERQMSRAHSSVLPAA